MTALEILQQAFGEHDGAEAHHDCLNDAKNEGTPEANLERRVKQLAIILQRREQRLKRGGGGQRAKSFSDLVPQGQDTDDWLDHQTVLQTSGDLASRGEGVAAVQVLPSSHYGPGSQTWSDANGTTTETEAKAAKRHGLLIEEFRKRKAEATPFISEVQHGFHQALLNPAPLGDGIATVAITEDPEPKR